MDQGDQDYSIMALEEMNDWISVLHGELQEHSSISYPGTDVRPLDHSYRKEIDDYLCEEFNLDYTAVLFFLDGMKAIYHAEDDLFLVSQESMQELPGFFEQEVLAHEKGHRHGVQLIQQRVNPLIKSGDVSDEAVSVLSQYFRSENFAERTKVALGNSLGFDFSYNQDSDDVATIYRLHDRIGPESLVDPERDETLEELAESIDELISDLSGNDFDWA